MAMRNDGKSKMLTRRSGILSILIGAIAAVQVVILSPGWVVDWLLLGAAVCIAAGLIAIAVAYRGDERSVPFRTPRSLRLLALATVASAAIGVGIYFEIGLMMSLVFEFAVSVIAVLAYTLRPLSQGSAAAPVR
jgi:hypothetical protein